LRAFFGPFAFDDGAASAITKSSSFFPDLIAAANHRGLNPRADVIMRFGRDRTCALLDTTEPPGRPPRAGNIDADQAA
jgi:hypothetical protein